MVLTDLTNIGVGFGRGFGESKGVYFPGVVGAGTISGTAMLNQFGPEILGYYFPNLSERYRSLIHGNQGLELARKISNHLMREDSESQPRAIGFWDRCGINSAEYFGSYFIGRFIGLFN